MEGMVDKVVQVVTNDGRNIIGLLKGFDQTTNVILDECRERVFSSDAGVEEVQLGLYILRGDNMCVAPASCPACTHSSRRDFVRHARRRLTPLSAPALVPAAPSWASSTRRRMATSIGRRSLPNR